MLHDASSDTYPTTLELGHVKSATLVTSVWLEPSVAELGDEERSVSTREANPSAISSKKTAIVICCVAYSTAITTYLSGVIVIAIPAISKDLQLPSNLVLWYVPASSYPNS